MKLNLKVFKDFARKAAKKTKEFVKKNAPEILLATGIASGVGATIVACKKTRTVDEVMEPYKEDILTAREAEDGKGLVKAYTNAAWAYMKHYKLSLLLGGVSIGSAYGSYKISANRYARLGAAYLSLDGAFTAYKERTKAIVGEEKENLINAGLEEMVVEETVDNGKGKTKKVKNKELVKTGDNPFSIWFDERNPNWTKDPEINFMFIRRQMELANRRLKRDGVITYNQVLDLLGYYKDDLVPEGQLVGWYIDDEHPNTYIDCGIYNIMNEHAREFLLGEQRSIYLVFNVMPSAWRRIGGR